MIFLGLGREVKGFWLSPGVLPGTTFSLNTSTSSLQAYPSPQGEGSWGDDGHSERLPSRPGHPGFRVLILVLGRALGVSTGRCRGGGILSSR